MITIITEVWIPSMKRISYFIALLLIAAQARLSAQETADGGQQAAPPAPVLTNPPSGLLTPPPDNAPTAAPVPAPAVPTSTSPATAKTTPSTSAKMSSSEIARIRQQEIIRRQELIFRANEAMKAARKSELATDYPEARKNYLFSAEAFGSISRSTDSYATAAEGLTRVDFQLYDDALKIGDTARAKMLMDEVVKYNPNNKLANEKLAAINRALANPNDTTLLGNPAVTPGFVDKVNEVQQLFAEAEQFRRTGQWDEAEARLKRILGIDPYNIAATKDLERIDAEKYQYDEQARLETRDERLRQVEEKWYEPITNKETMASAQEGQPSIIAHTNFGLDQKLKEISLSLDFNNATIEEATNFLSIESKRLDPEHKGVNFVIQPEASTTAKPVTITLNNVPLGEALRYVCQLANVKFKVQDYAISIVPFSQNTDDLISRNFNVQPDFVAPPAAAGVIESATVALTATRPIAAPTTTSSSSGEGTGGDTVRQALILKGVKFPPGASAVYTPSTGQLTVVDTADQMELLEELVNAGQAPTLMVRVATKFIEINQTDLNDLTVNSAFNFFNLGTQLPSNPITSHLLTGSSFNTALPGALGFVPDSVDQLISPPSNNTNAFFFRGILSGEQYNLVITALSQKKSTDLLSEPAVLTKSGEQGILEAVRVFPYPISFDPPELVSQTNTGGGFGAVLVNPPTVIATTPTDFKRRNVGVRLVVKPQVTADNKTVDLSLFPEVTDFEGFINYGSPIFVGNPDGTQSLLSPNPINQPVFNTRRINTKVLIRDGSTVVLGGLIRDDIQTVNDKVPLLGDIPLIGRLFQSKAVENTKKNLIIFVTANIYQNDGELLNPPEETNTADILTGHAGFTPPATP
jgi:general secretion pathway protein D